MQINLNINETQITSGTNLNTIQTPGTYYQTTDGNATLVLNYPVTKGGILEVFTNNTVQQRYTASDSSSVWIRTYYNSIWSNWNQIYPSETKLGNIDGVYFGGITGLNGNVDKVYHLTGTALANAVTGCTPELYMNFNNDSGVNYQNQLFQIKNGVTSASNSSSGSMPLTGGLNTSHSVVFQYEATITTGYVNGYSRLQGKSSAKDGTSGDLYMWDFMGWWNSGANITSLQFGLGGTGVTGSVWAVLTTPVNKP